MLPTGIITLWYGSIVSIPAGWVICDGNNGTPNLRDKFIVGAGSTYAVGANGGALTHDHFFAGDGHTHEIVAGASIAAGADYDDTTQAEAEAGISDTGSSLPPYYSLAYIMKT